MGRPSSFTQEVADEICERLASGESLRQICETEGFPTKETVFKWLRDGNFYAIYARAREMQADVMDERILEVAEQALDGSVEANAARVAIGAFQWRAARLKPKVYGDSTLLKHADPEGNKLEITVSRVSKKG